ncbi:MAG: hypothetical protein ACLGH0_03075 [Thermoanaerobaculia bacterium]
MSNRIRAAAVWLVLCVFATPLFAAKEADAKKPKRLGTQSSVDVMRLPPSEPGRQKGAKREHRRPALPKRKMAKPVVAQLSEVSTTPRTDVQPRAPLTSFEALGDDGTAIPPDTHGAAGLEHLMVTLNTQVRVMTRTGTPITTVAHDAFWSSTGSFDPKVHYDHVSDRWIFVALEGAWSANSNLLIAVSDTSNPTGTWTIHRIPADQEELGAWADFPIVGFNEDYLAVTVNMFTIANGGDFVQAQVFVFDKPALYADNLDFVYYELPYDFCLAPTINWDANAPLYLVESGFGGNDMYLFEVNDVSLDYKFSIYGEPWSWYGSPDFNFGVQLGGNPVDTGDDRVVNAIYQNGKIYASHTAFLPSSGPTYSVAQWWQFTPDELAPNATQFRIGAAGATWYAYPSIAVNEQNDLLLGYSAFNASQYVSAGYYFRTATAPGTPTTYKSGEANYFKTFGGFYNRWGDYSATVVDPVNDNDFWTIQEYAESHVSDESRWGTWWARVAGTVALGDPSNLVATASGISSVGVLWDAAPGAVSYQLERKANGGSFQLVASPTGTSHNDLNVEAGKSYVYRVRGVSATAATSAYSNVDVATTIVFTDDPLNAGTSVRRSHVTELRTAVNAMRAAAGLGAASFTDDPLALLGIIRATHLTQLRTNLDAARTALGLTAISYTDPSAAAGVTRVKAVHMTQLRDGVR